MQPPHLPETLDHHVQIHQVGDGVWFAVVQRLQRLQKQDCLKSELGKVTHLESETKSHHPDRHEGPVSPLSPQLGIVAESDTHRQVSPVPLDQVSQTIHQLPPMRSIHPPPRRAQLESCLGCLNSLVHICLQGSPGKGVRQEKPAPAHSQSTAGARPGLRDKTASS